MPHPRDFDSLDVEGVFHSVADPDREIAGRLTFNPVEGGRLRLIGHSFDIMPIGLGISEAVRFNGTTTSDSYTLDGCYPTANSYRFDRLPDVVFYVPLIVSTLLFEKDEPLDFSSIQVSLRHLEPWIMSKRISHASFSSAGSDQQDDSLGYSSVSAQHPPVDSSQLDGGELSLCFAYDILGDEFTSMTLSQRAIVEFVPTRPLDLHELLEVTGPIQQILTIAADNPAVYTDIRFEHPDLANFREEDPTIDDHAKLFTRMRGTGLGGDTAGVAPDKMLFSYADIGGIDGLVRWIRLAKRYRVVLNPLLGHKYQTASFVGNRLGDATGAADSFYLIRYGAEPGAAKSLRRRLVALAQRAGSTFCRIVGNPEDWATHVKNARTEIVHAGERDNPRYDDQAYGAFARSVYLVLVLCFLRELEVSEQVINRAIATRFQNLGARLRAAIGDEPHEDQQEAE